MKEGDGIFSCLTWSAGLLDCCFASFQNVAAKQRRWSRERINRLGCAALLYSVRDTIENLIWPGVERH